MDLGPIAQLVEHRVDNAGVSGSSPLGPTRKAVKSVKCKVKKVKDDREHLFSLIFHFSPFILH